MRLRSVHLIDQARDKIAHKACNATHRAPNPLVGPKRLVGIKLPELTQDGMSALSRLMPFATTRGGRGHRLSGRRKPHSLRIGMRIGIDASNLRGGGGVTHL